MSVAARLSALVGDPLATAEAKASRLERKETDAKAALEGLAGREVAARAALSQAVADEGDTKAAGRELRELALERETLAFEAEAVSAAAEAARRNVAEVRKRVARERAEAALASAGETATKARKVAAARFREVRDLTASAWSEEGNARALAKAAGLEVAFDFGLDLGAVCAELDSEILATNPPRGTAPSVTLSFRVPRP